MQVMWETCNVVLEFGSTHIIWLSNALENGMFLVRRLIESFPQCHHMSFVDFAVLSPGRGRSVTDF